MDKLIKIATSDKMVKHYKAFAWNLATMALAFGMDAITMIFTAWDPNNIMTIIIGLSFARITKELNTKNL